MIVKITFRYLVFCSLWWTAISCSSSAKDSKQASEFLLAAADWKIDEIVVNDAVNFKNGKMIQQFDGVNFERYMETVRFKPNGDFQGYFIGESNMMMLHWNRNPNDITIVAPDQKGGAWTISPADVTQDSFMMKTQSTAYDFPRMTKIELKFKLNK